MRTPMDTEREIAGTGKTHTHRRLPIVKEREREGEVVERAWQGKGEKKPEGELGLRETDVIDPCCQAFSLAFLFCISDFLLPPPPYR